MESVPVLVVYFNRPEVLAKTLAGLGSIRPPQLFLASDGPRDDHVTDAALLADCHRVVDELVTWPCDIHRMHAQTNHGPDAWLPKAITWFFGEVKEGIVLEDDCVIDGEFYAFASDMLTRYRDDIRVMGISAANFQSQRWGDGDYYFSRFPSSWGWASWRRAWVLYDPSLGKLERLISREFYPGISDVERRFWTRFLRGVKNGKYPFWDSRWVYAVLAEGGLIVTPNYNLVTNTGFGAEATHTRPSDAALSIPIQKMPRPARAPSAMAPTPQADTHWFNELIRPKFWGRVKAVAIRTIRSAMQRLGL